MSTLKELEKWKSDLEDLNEERIKAESKYEQAMGRLKEAGYSTVEEAQRSLEELQVKLDEAEIESKTFIEKLKEKYADFVE